MVFPFDSVDNGKVHLDGTPLRILKDFRTLVFEPVLNSTVFMTGDSGYVCFAGLNNPMNTIKRALIVGNATQPVVDNEVILQGIAPHHGILKLAFDWWIYAPFGDLAIVVGSVSADPDTTPAADCQI